MLDKLFYFKQSEYIKVQVFNIITEGRVVKRILSEDSKGNIIKKYEISFIGARNNDTVGSYESNLIEVQNLPLGEIE